MTSRDCASDAHSSARGISPFQFKYAVQVADQCGASMPVFVDDGNQLT